jgi:hypothetical protein
VLGNMKGVIAAVVSIALFRNTVTPRGVLGYAITVAGVFAYSESKRRARAFKALETAKSISMDEELAGAPLLPGGGGGGGKGGLALGGVSGGGGGSGLGVSGVAAVVQLTATAAAGRGSPGCNGVLPTSSQQLQQHRAARAAGTGSVIGGGSVALTVGAA